MNPLNPPKSATVVEHETCKLFRTQYEHQVDVVCEVQWDFSIVDTFGTISVFRCSLYGGVLISGHMQMQHFLKRTVGR